ncbi:hypothetical protein HA42_13900 [Pantoea deleyi]|nr:hypothetical protein HA42_13900 [Pantoea deleyi]
MDNEYMYQEAIGNIKYQAHKITYLANDFNASLIDAINLFLSLATITLIQSIMMFFLKLK